MNQNLRSGLFGKFKALHDQHAESVVVSYYDTPIEDFSGPHAWPQTWDIEAIKKLVEQTRAAVIADLGCGEGRLIWNLLPSFPSVQWVGVDASATAMKRFEIRFRGKNQVSFQPSMIGSSDVPDIRVDCALMGSVSINSFFDRAQVKNLFDYVDRILKPGGSFIMLCYQDHVRARMESISGASDVVSYQDREGKNQLIWREISYRPEKFLQNFFIQQDGERFPGTFGVLQERVWFTSEFTEISAALGWEVAQIEEASVDGGGANGWTCDALRFKRCREN